MNEGQTCYARDEVFCEDQMCLRTGCRISNSAGMQAAEQHYIDSWKRVIWDATGDQTKVDRAIELAELNGLFDPVRASLFACGKLAQILSPIENKGGGQ